MIFTKGFTQYYKPSIYFSFERNSRIADDDDFEAKEASLQLSFGINSNLQELDPEKRRKSELQVLQH
jgi:hypothetical protein